MSHFANLITQLTFSNSKTLSKQLRKNMMPQKKHCKEVNVAKDAKPVRPVEKERNQNTIAVKDIQRNADAHVERDVLVVGKLLNSNNYYTC